MHHVIQLIKLFDLAGERNLAIIERLAVQQRELRLSSKCGQRRTQFMGNAGRELFHFSYRPLKPRERFIECHRQLVDFVACSNYW